MHNDNWHKPTRSQMRHDYAHCCYAYPVHSRLVWRALAACAVVFLLCAAFVGIAG